MIFNMTGTSQSGGGGASGWTNVSAAFLPYFQDFINDQIISGISAFTNGDFVALTIYDFDGTDTMIWANLPPAYVPLYDENAGMCRYMAASFYEGCTSIEVSSDYVILYAEQIVPVASIVYPIG